MNYFSLKLFLLLALLALSNARRGGSFGGRGGSSHHSYPSSHGSLSGGSSHSHSMSGGSHSYPTSGGLSGSGGSHSYPSSGGLSGGGKVNPPLSGSGGSHSYPSGGMSGGSHTYPSSGGISGGSHSYPATGGKTVINNHYHYTPPQQIRYTPVYGGPIVSYPVYHGTPPVYVYHYKDSGSVYGDLLAGLALYNLGKLSASSHSSNNNYKAQPGEICKFGVKKDNGDYQETKIDCSLITSFIFEHQASAPGVSTGGNTVVTTTVTNITTVNNASPNPAPAVNVTYTMLPNGSLVPVNVSTGNTTSNVSGTSTNTTVTVTTTTTNSTSTNVKNALDVKGSPIAVTPGMQCYVIRTTSQTTMKNSIPCTVLQSYTAQSLKRSSASKLAPALSIISVVLTLLIIN